MTAAYRTAAFPGKRHTYTGEQAWEVLPEPFHPVAVESPGGGRVRDKRDPAPRDRVTVQGANGPVVLHRLAAEAWAAMVSAARADSIAAPLLLPISGYRSSQRQAQLWRTALARYGSPDAARKWVAPPGSSAHQSGRAIDFHLGARNDSANVGALRRTPAYRWLVANAQRFGFYPYESEPWHWEYNPPAQPGGSATSVPAPGGAGMTSPPPAATRPGVTPPQPSGRVEPAVLRRIARFDPLIDRGARETGVEGAVIRGIIAAESGGDPDAGRGTGGYKGLMQAGREPAQLDPATSIRDGARKFASFRQALQRRLRGFGIDLARAEWETVVRWVMVAYNAGPATVASALQYARAAGDERAWFAPEHFQRALVQHGAYNPTSALLRARRSPLNALGGDALAAELSPLSGMSRDEVRHRYGAAGTWNADALRRALVAAVEAERLRLRFQNIPWSEVPRRASRWLVYSVEFKYRNLPTYVERILTYARHFRGGDAPGR